MFFFGRHVQRAWHLVDASNQRVGRVATQIATLLRGKHKPTYCPRADIGDFVVVINADKVRYQSPPVCIVFHSTIHSLKLLITTTY